MKDSEYIDFCNELREYVSLHHHFPPKHTNTLNRIKYLRRKIKEGTLEDWKKDMFLEIAAMRDLSLHTGGRRKKTDTDSV